MGNKEHDRPQTESFWQAVDESHVLETVLSRPCSMQVLGLCVGITYVSGVMFMKGWGRKLTATVAELSTSSECRIRRSIPARMLMLQVRTVPRVKTMEVLGMKDIMMLDLK